MSLISYLFIISFIYNISEACVAYFYCNFFFVEFYYLCKDFLYNWPINLDNSLLYFYVNSHNEYWFYAMFMDQVKLFMYKFASRHVEFNSWIKYTTFFDLKQQILYDLYYFCYDLVILIFLFFKNCWLFLTSQGIIESRFPRLKYKTGLNRSLIGSTLLLLWLIIPVLYYADRDLLHYPYKPRIDALTWRLDEEVSYVQDPKRNRKYLNYIPGVNLSWQPLPTIEILEEIKHQLRFLYKTQVIFFLTLHNFLIKSKSIQLCNLVKYHSNNTWINLLVENWSWELYDYQAYFSNLFLPFYFINFKKDIFKITHMKIKTFKLFLKSKKFTIKIKSYFYIVWIYNWTQFSINQFLILFSNFRLIIFILSLRQYCIYIFKICLLYLIWGISWILFFCKLLVKFIYLKFYYRYRVTNFIVNVLLTEFSNHWLMKNKTVHILSHFSINFCLFFRKFHKHNNSVSKTDSWLKLLNNYALITYIFMQPIGSYPKKLFYLLNLYLDYEQKLLFKYKKLFRITQTFRPAPVELHAGNRNQIASVNKDADEFDEIEETGSDHLNWNICYGLETTSNFFHPEDEMFELVGEFTLVDLQTLYDVFYNPVPVSHVKYEGLEFTTVPLETQKEFEFVHGGGPGDLDFEVINAADINDTAINTAYTDILQHFPLPHTVGIENEDDDDLTDCATIFETRHWEFMLHFFHVDRLESQTSYSDLLDIAMWGEEEHISMLYKFTNTEGFGFHEHRSPTIPDINRYDDLVRIESPDFEQSEDYVFVLYKTTLIYYIPTNTDFYVPIYLDDYDEEELVIWIADLMDEALTWSPSKLLTGFHADTWTTNPIEGLDAENLLYIRIGPLRSGFTPTTLFCAFDYDMQAFFLPNDLFFEREDWYDFGPGHLSFWFLIWFLVASLSSWMPIERYFSHFILFDLRLRHWDRWVYMFGLAPTYYDNFMDYAVFFMPKINKATDILWLQSQRGASTIATVWFYHQHLNVDYEFEWMYLDNLIYAFKSVHASDFLRLVKKTTLEVLRHIFLGSPKKIPIWNFDFYSYYPHRLSEYGKGYSLNEFYFFSTALNIELDYKMYADYVMIHAEHTFCDFELIKSKSYFKICSRWGDPFKYFYGWVRFALGYMTFWNTFSINFNNIVIGYFREIGWSIWSFFF